MVVIGDLTLFVIGGAFLVFYGVLGKSKTERKIGLCILHWDCITGKRKASKRGIIMLKWVSKLLAIGILIFGIPFYFGYGNPLPFIDPGYTVLENTWLTIFPIQFIGLVIGLKAPKVGGLLVVVSISLGIFLGIIFSSGFPIHMLVPLGAGILLMLSGHFYPSKKEHHLLFNLIAPIYGLFYKSQKSNYKKILAKMQDHFNWSDFDTILDVGCGTGALCSALDDAGMRVTGIDPAEKMLAIGKDKKENAGIDFRCENVLEGLSFDSDSFDLSICSYVAHGLSPEKRKRMYAEMNRVTKSYVIIHDYNDKRSPLTTFVEWMEGGDYFYFIKEAETEMKNCINEMKTCFLMYRL